MALNTAGLAEAYLRKQQNKASQTDIANLNYAMSKGWKPTATPTVPTGIKASIPAPDFTMSRNIPNQQPMNYSIPAPTPSPNSGYIKITNPSELAGLTESQIYRSGADIYRLPQTATPPSYTGTPTQNAELNQAYERAKIGGQPQSQDLANIAYAESKGWRYQPKVPSEITSDDINNPNPDFQAGDAGTSPTDTGIDTASYMAGLDTTSKGIEAYLKNANKATPAEEQRGVLEARLQSLGDQYGDKSARELELRKQYQVEENTKRMMDLNTSIESLRAGYDKQIEQIQQSNGLTRIVGGSADRTARMKAVEVGALSAMAQAVQGNISTATKLAEDTANLEFGKIKNDLEMTREQIELNYEDMSIAEKKKADSLKVVLDERTRLIDKQESDRKSALDIATTAAANGADSTTMSKLAKAKTPEEALQIAGQYMADTSIQEIEGRKLLIDSQGNVIKDLGLAEMATAGDELQFISGTEYQPAGYFNKTTGEFVPLGEDGLTGEVKLLKETDAERTAFGFANRLTESNDIIGQLEQSGLKKENLLPDNALSNMVMSSDLQQLRQAQRNFINAVLRRESGAVISPEEFNNARKQYFPQPGDGEAVLKQKAANRATVLANMKTSAGNAWKNYENSILSNIDTNISDTATEDLGSLSQKYESGGDPGAIGYDSTGGASYGTYQLTKGNITKFLDIAKNIPGISNLVSLAKKEPIGSKTFNSLWKQMAKSNSGGFAKAQEEYIKQTHYTPQEEKIKKSGIDLGKYSNVLKQVIWSTAVQHGAGTNIIINAFNSLAKSLKRQPNEKELIAKIYEQRWSGGQNFKSSTPAVKKSVYNRLKNELSDAFKKLIS